jgi:hypothetical protein
MKKFIVMILCVATFFIGLGGLVESVGARFKSDERALELVRLARLAIGVEQALNNVRSLTISGRATKTFDFGAGARTEQGDWELNLQMPDKFSKMVKMRHESGDGSEKIENKQVDVIVVNPVELKEKVALPTEEGGNKKQVFVMKRGESEGDKVIVRKGEGDNVILKGEGGNVERKVIFDKTAGGAEFHHNELFRTTLFLFLTPPQGTDVSYTYAGEGNVDGANCDIIIAASNGANVKLYLDKTSHLPVMMTYQAPKMFMIKIKKDEAKADTNGDVKVFTKEKLPAPELAEFQVKFSDFRSVGGLQLPHRWTQTVGGKDDETIDITGYEINPANIDAKFKEMPNKVFFRTTKPQ